ncbi:hypothetical protein CDAR_402611 [Caerostris darwini]|uniref:Uncharacterized protein n=1 Tax=Caerostris darwini TaxID=1538125 RepID=A0AAV4RYP8_9ARAC|nr:hypothetical protein CDAR_402611 [Caerostris darwini]
MANTSLKTIVNGEPDMNGLNCVYTYHIRITRRDCAANQHAIMPYCVGGKQQSHFLSGIALFRHKLAGYYSQSGSSQERRQADTDVVSCLFVRKPTLNDKCK